MFSVNQKRLIADAIQKILRETNHPELPDGEIPFKMNRGSAGICIYCGTEMSAVGMWDGNGFECPKCLHSEPEPASWKMSGNYDALYAFVCNCENCKMRRGNCECHENSLD